MPYNLALAAAAASLSCAVAAQAVANFESGPVAPLRLAADGSRLFVADTVAGRLSVFDLTVPQAPFLVAEIPVGLDPVSVQPRTRDEVWVVNLLSDSVSVVSVPERRVVATLRVVDEPSDVVFAGGKAFVSAATTDEVEVFDAATHQALGTIPLFGKDPRALAVAADGTRVYAVVQRSGNGTTVLPAGVQAPPPPWNTSLPAAPAQGIVVRADDPAWAPQIPYTLPDNDVAEIDVATQAVVRWFRGVGTTNTAIAVHPATGELWVANTEARNLVRFEPNLRGHAIDSRVTRITTGPVPVVTPFDLNSGLDYSQLPNPAALATALAEPFGLALDAAAGRLYVAAHGTDRIGVLDLAGNVLARIEAGSTPGATVDPRQKRGPRALALHPTANLLYVLNRLSDTLLVVDRTTHAVVRELPIATWDPLPAVVRQGRKFLYDAKLSGNGTMSCAACHVDGDTDGLAWDLGDPAGVLEPPPPQPFPFNLGLTMFHPMKGPMTTQTLRGIDGTGVLHWRGDRTDFQAFNGAFASLLGGTALAAGDMDDFAAAVATVRHPPNPNQLLDRSLRTAPAGNNEAAGRAAFLQNVVTGSPVMGNCASCHALPVGTFGLVINGPTIQEPQQFKIPQLRNLYRKVGFERAAAPQKSGFGFLHDGAIDTLATFFAQPVFNPWPSATKDDLVTFLLAFDTGTAPAVGYQFHLTAATAGSPQVAADLALVTARAAAGDLELIAHGVVDGRLGGLLYAPATGLWTADRTGAGPWTTAQLQSKALAAAASLVLTAVAPGTGQRKALDRDGDGVRDGDQAGSSYGTATAGCAGEPRLFANSEPRRGNLQFGYAMANAPANSFGVLGLALAPSALPVLGFTLLVDPATLVILGTASSPTGDAQFAWPILTTETLGLHVFAQVAWLDACAPELFSASAGFEFTVVP
ncbi:MAG: beta-propeller fold lactonase family protein [Planctomycetes bacterium]|nr:beta-propeller fold lactonase family protein [Planctomycetota bacterium]